MIQEPTIRFVEPADIDEVIKLCALHAAYEKCDYDPTGKNQLLSDQIFAEQPGLYCLVVTESDALIGYATYMKQFSTWDATHYLYMDCIFMIEASRGKGLGEELMNRIKAEARENESSHVQWQTPDFNDGAIRFYKRIGANSKTKERFFLDV